MPVGLDPNKHYIKVEKDHRKLQALGIESKVEEYLAQPSLTGEGDMYRLVEGPIAARACGDSRFALLECSMADHQAQLKMNDEETMERTNLNGRLDNSALTETLRESNDPRQMITATDTVVQLGDKPSVSFQ
jgi:hypothetical protein